MYNIKMVLRMSNLYLAICVASSLSDKDFAAITRLSFKKYSLISRKKHAKAKTIRKRNTSNETAYGYAKKIKTILKLAAEIRTNGNLLISDPDELQETKVITSILLSDFFKRPFFINY